MIKPFFLIQLCQTYYDKGNTLNDLGRYEEALKAYDQAILLNPNYTQAFHNKGSIFHNMKRYEEAPKPMIKPFFLILTICWPTTIKATLLVISSVMRKLSKPLSNHFS